VRASWEVMTATRSELPGPVAPMLASAGVAPSGPGWAFEFKWDGVRAIAAVAGDQLRLYSRNGNDITGGYPELAALSGLIEARRVLLDGEIVTLGAAGRPDFGLLQQRMHVRAPITCSICSISTVTRCCHRATSSAASCWRAWISARAHR